MRLNTEKELPQHEYVTEEISEKLVYYPTVTRESFENKGRLTDAGSWNEATNKLELLTRN